MDNLPIELWKEISCFMPTHDLLTFASTCKIAHSLLFDKYVMTNHEFHLSSVDLFRRISFPIYNLMLRSIKTNDFSKMKHVKKLSCFWGSWRIEPECFAELENLESINVAGCVWITDSHLKKLLNLKHLNISGCKQIYGWSFEHLTKLETLIMVGSTMDPAYFIYLNSLTFLNAQYCKFITNEMLKPLSNLVHLNISRCHNDCLTSGFIKNHPLLKSLCINFCSFPLTIEILKVPYLEAIGYM